METSEPRQYPVTGQPRKSRTSFVDLTGRTFGRWSVLAEVPKTRPGQSKWRCRCSCGTVKESLGYTSLVMGRSKSCGCLKREKTAAATKPLHERHSRCNPTWRSWDNVRDQCGPGWTSFDQFLADMGPRPPDARLRRRDTAKPFTKDNCYWGTRKS